MDPGVERLRGAARDLKARQETSRDQPDPQAPSPAPRRDPSPPEGSPAVVRGTSAATRRTSRSLLTSSTMRSRHLRILR